MFKYTNILHILICAFIFGCAPSRHFTYNDKYSGTIRPRDMEYNENKYKERTTNENSTPAIKKASVNSNISDYVYIIKKGDSLYKISREYGISVDYLISYNNIKNRNKIYSGMEIKIPDNKIINSSGKENYKITGKDCPSFLWPVTNIYNTQRDGLTGVKSIGILITAGNNAPVMSSAGGIVSKVGNMRGFGNYIIMAHSNNYLTIYSHLKDVRVKTGDRIEDGKIIALIDKNQLHFQISYDGRPEDPLKYLKKR